MQQATFESILRAADPLQSIVAWMQSSLPSSRRSTSGCIYADRLPHGRELCSQVVDHILITGMSGVGKSSVLSELSRRGHRTVDTDYGPLMRADGTWDEPRMAALLSAAAPIVVSGTVENQGRFYDRFAAVVLLSAPVDVLLHRLSVRTNNPYGKSESDQAEVRRYVRDIEPLLRRGATLELDACRPVGELADEIEKLVVPPGSTSAP